MELWIRSQYGSLLEKAEAIKIANYDGTICIVINNDDVFGKYKTKERAIEVLDEIQNILKPKYILNTSSIKPDGDFYEENGVIFQKYNANARIQELSTFVYQMPAE